MLQPPIPDSAQRIVTSLAFQAKVPVESVTRLYEAKHAELDREARIKSFLPIFAIRGVQEALREGARGVVREQAKPDPYGDLVGAEVTVTA